MRSIAIPVAGGDATRQPSSGATPYGFDFTPDGTLVVTEAFGGTVGAAAASSYAAGLQPISKSVANTRSEVCWAAVTKDGRYVFVTNFGDGSISSYAIDSDGSLSLVDAVAGSTTLGDEGRARRGAELRRPLPVHARRRRSEGVRLRGARRRPSRSGRRLRRPARDGRGARCVVSDTMRRCANDADLSRVPRPLAAGRARRTAFRRGST